jgi:hypothetical protein
MSVKVTELRAQVSVPAQVKRFALVLSILDQMYTGDRNQFLTRLCHYYGVSVP